MKPTHILIKGGQKDFQLPQCNMNCPYRIPSDPTRHKSTIRIDNQSHPQQVKVEGAQRHAIPAGVLDNINTSHMRMLKQAEEELEEKGIKHEQAPSGMFALIDESHERKWVMTQLMQGEVYALSCKECPCVIATNLTKKEKKQVQWRILHAKHGHQCGRRIGKRKLKGLQKGKCPICLAAKMCRKAHTGTLTKGKFAMHIVHAFRHTNVLSPRSRW